MKSLPAWIYENDEFLELEKEQIFLSSWQLACHQSDIPNPGDYETFTIFDQDLFVIRGKDNEIRAFYNVCRHRAFKLLGDGEGNCGDRITCPYHAWSYNSLGELTNVPFIEDYEDLDMSAHGLVEAGCEILLGFVFVCFKPGNSTPKDFLAPGLEELSLYKMEQVTKLVDKSVQHVAVNWKNGTDNYIDAMHVRVAHPGLNSLLNKTYEIKEIAQGVQRLSGRVEHIVGKSEVARRYHQCLPDVDFLPDSHKRLWLYYMFWPNLAFNLYPDQIEFMQFLPVDANHTRIRFGAYGIADDREEMTEARHINIELNNEVGIEDRFLIESVQRGMGSISYNEGPLGKNEVGLIGFAEQMRREIPVANELTPPVPGMVRQRNEELKASP